MALAGFKIIDADGHVTEPASLYSTHVDPKFRPAADALLSRIGTGNLGIVPALYPKWRSAERPLGEANEIPGLGKLPSGRNHPMASPAGGYDPAERIRDMDKEGIDVAVCFATVATSVCAATDPAMEAALARAYNRWVGEYCGAFPSRIKAVGIVPQREMERCAAEVAYLAREPWAVGIMTFGNLDGMLPDHPYFDPLYRSAQDADLPICFHGGTDRPPFAPGREDVGNNMFMIQLTGHVWHQMARDGGGGRRRIVRALPDAQAGVFRRRNFMGAVVGRSDGRALQALRATHATPDAKAVGAHARGAMLLHIRPRRGDVARGDASDRRAALDVGVRLSAFRRRVSRRRRNRSEQSTPVR